MTAIKTNKTAATRNKGSRFDVETESGIVSVLGTSFNAKSRPLFFEVVCYSGLVHVNSENTIAKLKPGTSYRILNGEVVKRIGLNEAAPSWLNNESSFVSVTLDQVLSELERQYDIQVHRNEIDTLKLFTGTFPNNNIKLALQAITIPFNLEFEITDEKTVIISK